MAARVPTQEEMKELQRRRQVLLRENEDLFSSAPESSPSVMPKRSDKQMNLYLLDPAEPQVEYFEDDHCALRAFQGVIANKLQDREKLSNLFTAWSSIPKYNGAALAGKSQSVGEPLPILTHRFIHDGDEFVMKLTPAQIQEVVDGKEESVFYYPGITEEYLELSLVKMAMERAKLFEPHRKGDGYAYGATFSLSGLRNFMSAQKKGRTYPEIVKSLDILNKCNLEVIINGESTASAPILPEKLSHTQNGYKNADPSSRWSCRFHPLISTSINNRNYRQYNITRLMDTKTRAALSLSKMLLTQARNLSSEHPFRIFYTDFVKHCGELNYTRRSDGIRKFIRTAESLKKFGTLSEVRVKKIFGSRSNRVVDVELELFGSDGLIKEIKAGHVKERIVLEQYEIERKRLEKQESEATKQKKARSK